MLYRFVTIIKAIYVTVSGKDTCRQVHAWGAVRGVLDFDLSVNPSSLE